MHCSYTALLKVNVCRLFCILRILFCIVIDLASRELEVPIWIPFPIYSHIQDLVMIAPMQLLRFFFLNLNHLHRKVLLLNQKIIKNSFFVGRPFI